MTYSVPGHGHAAFATPSEHSTDPAEDEPKGCPPRMAVICQVLLMLRKLSHSKGPITPGHGHPARVVNPEALALAEADSPSTPERGRDVLELVVLSTKNSLKGPTTAGRRMSACAARRSSLLSTAADVDEAPPSTMEEDAQLMGVAELADFASVLVEEPAE